jgi:polysaccharide biosynthesis protein PslG
LGLLASTALALFAVIVLPGDGQEAAALPASEVGIVADVTWGAPRADIDREITLLAASGVRWVRANVSWSAAQPVGPRTLDPAFIGDVDHAVRSMRALGLQVLMPIADGVPYWASSDPAKYVDASGQHWNRLREPQQLSDYTVFVQQVVARYAPMGVHAYEVWNEPNSTDFWPAGPDAAAYTRMLQQTYPVIKAADPSAVVVMGGLSKNDYTFLEEMYAAGAAGFFDVANVHPYSGAADPTLCWNQAGTNRKAKDAICGIEEIHAVMQVHGDGAKPLWLTELGWSTSGEYAVSPTQQGTYLVSALDVLRTKYPYVRVAMIYSLRDTGWLGTGADDSGTGLLTDDFTPKPAFESVRTYLQGGVV